MAIILMEDALMKSLEHTPDLLALGIIVVLFIKFLSKLLDSHAKRTDEFIEATKQATEINTRLTERTQNAVERNLETMAANTVAMRENTTAIREISCRYNLQQQQKGHH